MSDIYSPEKRSAIMRKISAKETKPEIRLRKYLFSNGFRFRKNVKKLPGCPDIVLAKYQTVIFVNGCFWHGHRDCTLAKLPASNVEFWASKIAANKQRDKSNIEKLKAAGWNVVTVWQCEINSISKSLKRLPKLLMTIRANESRLRKVSKTATRGRPKDR